MMGPGRVHRHWRKAESIIFLERTACLKVLLVSAHVISLIPAGFAPAMSDMVDSLRNLSLRPSLSWSNTTVSPWLSSYWRTRGAGMVTWSDAPILRSCLIAGNSIAHNSTNGVLKTQNSLFNYFKTNTYFASSPSPLGCLNSGGRGKLPGSSAWSDDTGYLSLSNSPRTSPSTSSLPWRSCSTPAGAVPGMASPSTSSDGSGSLFGSSGSEPGGVARGSSPAIASARCFSILSNSAAACPTKSTKLATDTACWSSRSSMASCARDHCGFTSVLYRCDGRRVVPHLLGQRNKRARFAGERWYPPSTFPFAQTGYR